MKIAAALGLILGLSPSFAFAIDGGALVPASDPIAASTVMVNVIFSGFPGDPPAPEPDQPQVPCTGTIIAKHLVLTAAHCIKQYSRFDIRFGLSAAPQSAVVRHAVAFDVPLAFRYGDANPNNRSDVALLYFDGSIPKGFRPAKLLTDVSSLTLGSNTSLAGYGPCGDWSHCALTKMDTTIAGTDYLPAETQVVNHQGSAKNIGGDSGGPAYFETAQGATVYGVDSGSWVDGVEIYTNISTQMDWLNAAAKRLKKTKTSRGPGWGSDDSGSSSPVGPTPGS